MTAEIHFLDSGNGDTILVRGGNEWGLVDGNFVKAFRVRERAEALLRGVERLRFVCVTHFDLDHIRGLGDFLTERFSEIDSNNVRHWRIDQVITPLDPLSYDILKGLKKSAEYAPARMPLLKGDYSKASLKMLETLREMLDTKGAKPEFLCLAPRQDLIGPLRDAERNGLGPWRVMCLGPQCKTSGTFSRLLERHYEGQGRLPGLSRHVEQNGISRVLALQHFNPDFSVLLTGDSTRGELRVAVAEWDCINTAKSCPNGAFRIIKVSHHGALSCHVPELYQKRCNRNDGDAVICAADTRGHPHRVVIGDLHAAKIRHRVTGISPSAARRNRARGVPMGAPTNVTFSDVKVNVAEGKCQVSGGRASRFAAR